MLLPQMAAKHDRKHRGALLWLVRLEDGMTCETDKFHSKLDFAAKLISLGRLPYQCDECNA